MADPINPQKKRVLKTTEIKKSDKKSTSGVETKTVFRRDRVTPKKIVTTNYINYYTPKGGVLGGGSTVTSKEKQRFDKSGKLKSITTLTPAKKGGSVKPIKKMEFGGAPDPTRARKCPKGKCGKVSSAPVGNDSYTLGSKIKSGIKKLFTDTHKAGPSRAKRIR